MTDIPLNWDCENCHQLQAEIERLQPNSENIKFMEEQNIRLQARVEKLEAVVDAAGYALNVIIRPKDPAQGVAFDRLDATYQAALEEDDE